MLHELNIVMRENNCPHIVQFYGALFKEGDCWICMELMNTSLDYFYKFVYHKLDQCIPESVLAYITLSVRSIVFKMIIRISSIDFKSIGLYQIDLANYSSRC
jgi:serine/threonine protein kinase